MGFTDFLKKAFPFISIGASLIPGGSPVVGIVANVLGKVIGSDVKPSELSKQIEQLSMTEEGRLKLDAAEKELQVTMAKLGYDSAEKFEEMAASDRASARNREIQVKDKTPAVLAYTVTVGFFLMMGIVMKWGVPGTEAGRDAALLLIGALSGGFVQNVLGYYFGSSAGSAQKNDLLAGKK